MSVRQTHRLLGTARPIVSVVSAVTLAGYALALASTRPFTLAADVLAAIGCATGCLVARRTRRGRAARRREGGASELRRRDLGVWIAITIAIVGYEIAEVLQAPRVAHPTLSSLADEAGATTLGRAGLVIVWMGLFVVFVR